MKHPTLNKRNDDGQYPELLLSGRFFGLQRERDH
jgi:hypothetical protein